MSYNSDQHINQYNQMHNTIEYFIRAFTSDMDGKDNQYYLQQLLKMLNSSQSNLSSKKLGNKLFFASRVDKRTQGQAVQGNFERVVVFTISGEQIGKVDIFSVTEIDGVRKIVKHTVTDKVDFVEESHPTRLPNHYQYMVSIIPEIGGHSYDER